MLIQNKQIAIVGGGPAGLTLARLLQIKGVNVKVYERDINKEARLIGSPLDMHEESGMAALRAADLVDEFKKNYRPGADRKTIANKQAEIRFTTQQTNSGEGFGDKSFRPEIDRYPLERVMHFVRWQSKI